MVYISVTDKLYLEKLLYISEKAKFYINEQLNIEVLFELQILINKFFSNLTFTLQCINF